MSKRTCCFMVIAIFALLTICPAAPAGQLEPLGKGLTVWFDTGGPVGGPYNTVVQNGAVQAAADLGCTLKLLYSDWNPEKMIENFKTAVAARPAGVVIMGHPGDDAYAPFVKEAMDAGVLVTCVDQSVCDQSQSWIGDNSGSGIRAAAFQADGKQIR